MTKKFIQLGAALAFSLALLVPITSASAAGLNTAQVNAIISLLRSFGADQSVISNVQASLTGTSVPSNPTTCVDLSYSLYTGQTDSSTNGDVTRLQSFLGVSPTGYFGPMTEQAVQKWQIAHQIVSSGSPDTTGFGLVGPQTSEAMGCGGNTQQQDGKAAATPAITVTSSVRPNVSFTYANLPGADIQGIYLVSATTGTNVFSIPTNATTGSGNMLLPNSVPAGQYFLRVLAVTNNRTIAESATFTVPGASDSVAGATIDQSSLTTRSGDALTITGSASEVSSVLVVVAAPNQSGNNVGTVINNRWSATLYPKAEDAFPAGTYTVTVYGCTAGDLNCAIAPGPVLASDTLTVTGGSVTASATIDQNTMSQQTGSSIISGTAANISAPSEVTVAIVPTSVTTTDYNTTTSPYTRIAVLTESSLVSAGKWFAHPMIYTPGAYKVLVYDFSSHVLLAQSILIVSSSVQSTAAIDQNSLTTTNMPPTITGTAQNIDAVEITVKGYSAVKVPVVNGHWSATLSDIHTAGTYGIQVTNTATGYVVARGTLVTSSEVKQSYLPSAGPLSGAAPLTVSFSVAKSDPGAYHTSRIDFGDGSQMSTSAFVCGLQYCTMSHTYTNPGNYRVVFSDTNGQGINTLGISVTSVAVAPTTLSITPTSGTNLLVQYTNAPAASVLKITDASGVLFASLGITQGSGTTGAALPSGSPAGNYTATIVSSVTGIAASATFSYGTVASTMATCPANATAQRGQNGTEFACMCPKNFPIGTIWGGSASGGYRYTDDSNVCTAAIQAGQTSQESGGEVDYTIDPGQSSYLALIQNGITSQSWGSWPGSFQITGPKACLAAGTVISMADGSHKNIENIRVGDLVTSFDAGKSTIAAVATVMQRKDPIVTINGVLRAAPDEVVYLANGKKETAGRLKIGDKLLGEGGRTVTVSTIASSSTLEKTYDLALSNGNAFFADGYLVQSFNPSSK